LNLLKLQKKEGSKYSRFFKTNTKKISDTQSPDDIAEEIVSLFKSFEHEIAAVERALEVYMV
jgi:hypothetical protein